ncbi:MULTISPECIES: hypothetical protein [Pseudomonas]|nr:MULTISPECIES: hypothetical protein [Pseudomonas]MDC7828404.1 hypothetical protein [Pseudomonas benzopyrenica]SEP28704.1 hypothetical protein SAMN02787149_105295 [Pseudomonas sp. Snoq117.2]
MTSQRHTVPEHVLALLNATRMIALAVNLHRQAGLPTGARSSI